MELTRKEVTVIFHPAGIADPDTPILTFEGSGITPDKEIWVPQGFGMIVFSLKTEGEPTNRTDLPVAMFQTAPVQWLANVSPTAPTGTLPTVPVETPTMFTVQRIGDWNLTILDFNSTPGTENVLHTFNIVVVYEGKTYGTDPVIVNEPPAT